MPKKPEMPKKTKEPVELNPVRYDRKFCRCVCQAHDQFQLTNVLLLEPLTVFLRSRSGKKSSERAVVAVSSSKRNKKTEIIPYVCHRSSIIPAAEVPGFKLVAIMCKGIKYGFND